MKKVSQERKELRRRAESISSRTRKFRWWGLALLLLGIGLALGGFPAGVLIYALGFGLLMFSLLAGLLAWHLKRKFKGS